jgi:outer membrane translocation and assembly module TamA
MASQNKRKRSIINELFGNSLFDETKLLDEFPSNGYSISVVQTPEGTKVRAKVGKDTDVNTLRKQLRQKYPNAEIKIESAKKEPLIREISTKTLKRENNEKQSHE